MKPIAFSLEMKGEIEKAHKVQGAYYGTDAKFHFSYKEVQERHLPGLAIYKTWSGSLERCDTGSGLRASLFFVLFYCSHANSGISELDQSVNHPVSTGDYCRLCRSFDLDTSPFGPRA